MINRRKFLGLAAIGAVAAPMVARAAQPVVRQIYEAKTLAPCFTSPNAWFLKGGDGVALYNRAHPISAEDFRRMVEPGLNRAFNEAYSSHSAEWEATFGPEQLTLFGSHGL